MSDTASIRSGSSSKRSRSIYAPHRENSLAPELISEPVPALSHNGDADDRIMSSGVSEASRSLHQVLMDQPEPNRPPLFADDLKAYRSNPQALCDLSKKELVPFMARNGGVHHVIQVLARDLADKDAEMTRLRAKNDKYAYLFKDHLTREHDMPRLEADKIVQSYFPVATDTTHPHTDDVRDAILEASTDDLVFNPGLTSAGASDTALSAHASQPTNAVAGRTLPLRESRSSIFGAFFGRSAAKSISNTNNAKSNKRASHFLDISSSNPKAPSMRSPSLSESRPNANYPPLELEQTYDEESLPPPLLTIRQLVNHFHDTMFDNYGFVIDDNRVYDYLKYCADQEHEAADASKIAPASSSKSVKSRSTSIISTDGDAVSPSTALESELPVGDPSNDISGVPSKTWVDYLKIGGTLGLLALVPSQPSASPEKGRASVKDGQSVDNNDDLPGSSALDGLVAPDRHKEYAITLRDEISQEYCDFQKERVQAWSRLSSIVGGTTASNNRLSRLLPGATHAGMASHGRDVDHTFSSSSIGIASLATSQHQDAFIKFVLSGIPMRERAKIYLENAESKIHYSPEAFEAYKEEFRSMDSEQFQSMNNDINADKGRTLTNNIFFRREFEQARGKDTQSELASILRAFCVRNPQIGYIQGFNLIAGYLMLAMPTTEKAFWVFCYMIESVLPPDYFTDRTFEAMRIDTMVLRQCMRQNMPRLARHMDELGVPDEQTVPINWLITAFASTLSVEALFRIWDVVLSIPGQSYYMFRVALILLKMNEDKLLRTDSIEELYQVLDRGLGTGVNIDGLVQASWMFGRNVTPALINKYRDACAARM